LNISILNIINNILFQYSPLTLLLYCTVYIYRISEKRKGRTLKQARQDIMEEELRQTKHSLTELLDEVVYFEQQCNVAQQRGDNITRIFSQSNVSHRECIEVLISFANSLTSGDIVDASSAHANALRMLRNTSNIQNSAADSLASLQVSGCQIGWTLNGQDEETVLKGPKSQVNNNNNNGTSSTPFSTPFGNEISGGGGRVRMTRSGSVLAEAGGGSYIGATPSNTGGTSYTDLRINELVAALEEEQKTSNELRQQLYSSNNSPAPLSSSRVSSISPNKVHVTRRGSVEIQVQNNRGGNASNETVEALRLRVRELEVELADEKVRANAAERDRAQSVRDRDAAIMDLERAERERESSLQSAKSSDLESDAAREASRRLEREIDLAKRGKLAAERSLSDALVERDRAFTTEERAMKILEQSKQSESEAIRQRDEALDHAEAEKKRADEATQEKERCQYREDELKRNLATSEQGREAEIAKCERTIQERDSARAERDSLQSDCDSLRKRLEQAERERGKRSTLPPPSPPFSLSHDISW
jgi:hypothetical protein